MRKGILAGVVLTCSSACVAIEHEVILIEHRFEPPMLIIAAGDTVRWTNASGMAHNVRADDDRFRCSVDCGFPEGGGYGYGGSEGNPSAAAWSFDQTFGGEETLYYHCEAHGASGGVGMSGRIEVQAPAQEPFAINFGLTGPWYNSSTSGKGFYVDVVPSFDPPLVTLAWFTFDLESGGQERQRWFTGLGAYQEGSDQLPLSIFRTTTGRFDLATPPAQTEAVGSAMLQFDSCLSANFSYTLELGSEAQPDARSGSIALQRTTPDVLCASLTQPDGER